MTIRAVILSVEVCAAVVGFHQVALAQPKTETRLFFSAESAKPGQTVWAGLELKMAPHWHTYWRYQGDAGLPTTVTWTLPPGISAGEIQWPLPEKNLLTAGTVSLCTYIYEGRVVLLVPIKLDAGIPTRSLRLRAALNWLECEDGGVCVQGKSVLDGDLEVGEANRASPEVALIEQWRARLPQTSAPARATAQWESISPGDTRAIIIDWKSAEKQADFYPYEHQPSDVQGPTAFLPASPGHFRMRKVLKKYNGDWPEKLRGILVGNGDSPNPASVEVDLPLLMPAVASTNGAGGK